MHKKIVSGLLLISLLVLMLNQTSHCETQSATFQGWQVENFGGQYSESNSTFRLSTPGGFNDPLISLYRQILPNADFSFSCEVKAATPESCAIVVKSKLPIGGDQGFNLEFGHYGEGVFILSRHTEPYNWTWNTFATGDKDVWYTMKLNVFKDPFKIVAEVFDENGTLLASTSASDMSNLSFEDIRYLGFTVWGYSPSDYFFRNIKSSLDNPSYISISTESSSTTAGSAVNVFGTLTSSSSKPIQNRTVVLSYTFPGADTWIPVSSGLTDEQGNYNIQWINSASGTFTLKTEWSGDSTYLGVSNTATLNFLPFQNKQVFTVESNSTVYGLAFNNETSILSFNVTGPSNTTGYVKASISKTSLANGDNLQVQMDGRQINYSVTSTADSWVVFLNYSHSTHQISIHLETNASTPLLLGNEVVLLSIIALFGTIIAIIAKQFLGRKDKIVGSTA
jgi:hypothetical protein